MKNKLYILLICCCLFTSCWFRHTSRPQVKGCIYNAETLLPESDVKISMEFDARFGGSFIYESFSNHHGDFEFEEEKNWTIPGKESAEMWPTRDFPIILEKKGYLNDTIILEDNMVHYIIDNEKKNKYHYKVDTLYFRARKIQ